MQGWYEFGFNGFPTGEKRRRFYRQRDDPCDSEEERDYDDETNDRPIFYYPLRESEEESRSSSADPYSSATASVSSCDAEADAEEESRPAWLHARGAAAHPQDVAQREPLQQQQQQRRRRWRRNRPRRAEEEGAVTRWVLHSTLYEDTPAWYGATAVPLATSAAPDSAAAAGGLMLSWQYGGAPCASPLAISSQASLWCWAHTHTTGQRASCAAREEASGRLHCSRVPDDARLAACIQWSRLHPSLRLGRTAAMRPLPRLGHCCVSLAALDTSLLLFFLTDQRPVAHTAVAGADVPLPRSSDSTAERVACGSAAGCALVADSEVELHASVVVGGASRLTAPTPSHVSCGGRLSAASAPHADAGAGPSRVGGGVAAGDFCLDRATIPHACALSHPVLCLTLVKRRLADGAAAAAAAAAMQHHTVFLPLDTPSSSALAPRAFATLTPWTDPAAEAAAVRTFAYVGGTENGRDPLAFLELELFRLHLETWTWSTTPVATYGAKPAPRFGHSANAVDADGSLLLFGGVGMGRVYLNDLHVLDTRTRVWREVFVPSNLAVPRRAFHMSAILTDAALSSHVRGSWAGDRFASPPAPLAAFTHAARSALCSDASDAAGTGAAGSVLRGPVTAAEHERGDADGDDGDVWPTSVTNNRSCSTLVLLGGECEGHPVLSSWTCALRSNAWRRVAYPLRGHPGFFHVAQSCVVEGCRDTAPVQQRRVSRREFRAVVDGLMQRSAQAEGDLCVSASRATPRDDPYVAACHGSLGQLLLCPSSHRHAEQRLLVVGGSQGPPVSVVTQLEPMGQALRDTASMWLLHCQQRNLLCPTAVQRVPALSLFLFSSNAVLSQAARYGFAQGGSATSSLSQQEQQQQQRVSAGRLSESTARSDRMDEESVLDSQLVEWTRLARKRLRDSA